MRTLLSLKMSFLPSHIQVNTENLKRPSAWGLSGEVVVSWCLIFFLVEFALSLAFDLGTIHTQTLRASIHSIFVYGVGILKTPKVLPGRVSLRALPV